MAADTQTSANGLVNQLRTLYPGKTTAQLWSMVGIIEMIGVDDFGPAETFTLANATTVTNWAKSQGIASLSFWALQRDNGGCPGTAGSDTCSGVHQSRWAFSRALDSFTRRRG
jgi:chitinase